MRCNTTHCRGVGSVTGVCERQYILNIFISSLIKSCPGFYVRPICLDAFPLLIGVWTKPQMALSVRGYIRRFELDGHFSGHGRRVKM